MQRTLVKSPPELWAELSDHQALTRHLGELGEIRITATEPETRVDWEAPGTRGTVYLSPSGWGTKVTLSVTRELDPPAPPSTSAGEVATDEPPAAPSAAPEPHVSLAEPSPADDLRPAVEAEPPSSLPVEAEPAAGGASPDHVPGQQPSSPESRGAVRESRPGFLARFLALWRQGIAPADIQPQEPVAGPPPTGAAPAGAARDSGIGPEATVEPPEPAGAAIAQELPALQEPAPEKPVPDEASPEQRTPAQDLAAELRSAEEAATEEVTAVLTAALDRLGSAHHRPFSRA
ncbi:MAG TPA: hypothetical protein VKG62_04030 [Solirubrobacteraceae bacterium]|nr:hypothetical protein [Solirubrobacteraceae bacterium]